MLREDNMQRTVTVTTIISGGQTGADRAALDFALARDIAIAGYCPRGRRADDGKLNMKYPLKETASSAYPPRTCKNVILADATVIFNGAPRVSSGTRTTVRYAQLHQKKYKVLRGFPNVEKDAIALEEWLVMQHVTSLNVAGNREEGCRGIYRHVFAVLERIWR